MSRRKQNFDAIANENAKKKRIGGAQDKQLDTVMLCTEMLEALRQAKQADGRPVCNEVTLRAPSRRSTPEYYKSIASAIDITRIQQKLKTDEYKDVQQLIGDVKLVVDNTKAFYKPDSVEHKDACAMWDAFEGIKTRVLQRGTTTATAAQGQTPGATTDAASHEPSPAPSTRSVRSMSPSARSHDSPARSSVPPGEAAASGVEFQEELLCCVLELADVDGRLITPPFRIVPSKESIPEYHDIVKNPIDLKTIAGKIRDGAYKTLSDMERDFAIMAKNAKLYNGADSKVFNDAQVIVKFVKQRKAELLKAHAAGIQPDRAARNKEDLDALLAQEDLEDEVPDGVPSEDSDEDEETESSTHPGWQLYWLVRNADQTDADDEAINSEAFCSLPSKNWYPDYYDEIKQPMSLFLVNKRLKAGEYADLQSVFDDMLLIFENARSYNIEGSEIYESALKFQLMVVKKAQELDANIRVPPVLQAVVEAHAADQDESVSNFSGVKSPGASTVTSTTFPQLNMSNLDSPTPKPPRRKRDPNMPRQKPGRKPIGELQERYRNQLMSAWAGIAHAKDEATGRPLAAMFMDLPDRAVYPDYYAYIVSPVCLTQIKHNIETDRYNSTAELGRDIQLMLDNARNYNEDGSQVHVDANRLQKVFEHMFKHWAEGQHAQSPKFIRQAAAACRKRDRALNRTPSMSEAGKPPSNKQGIKTQLSRSKLASPLGGSDDPVVNDCQSLFSIIKYHKDKHGRLLARTFNKLPSKEELPDYYEVIRRPMDMERIGNQLHKYTSLDALVADFNTMFDNACRYNEPESYIYKDALALQKAMLDQKRAMGRSADGQQQEPNVQAGVQELLTSLFVTVHSHEDAEGRCYTDSFVDLDDLVARKDGVAGGGAKLLTLDKIKRSLQRGRYKRLDRFQADVFSVFDTARRVSRSDSQLFEDSVELQQAFIAHRDQLCVRGQKTLYSPALHYDERHLTKEIEELRETKRTQEVLDDQQAAEDPALSPTKAKVGDEELPSYSRDGVDYRVGDFVYVQQSEADMPDPHIIRIERIWRDPALDDEVFVNGNWFYRPHETVHLARRKFIEQEVFKSVFYDNVLAERLLGKCHVMFIADYIKQRPKELGDKDVYVCESAYHGKPIYFKKMKVWPFRDTDIELVDRTEPLKLSRAVPSVFKGLTGTPPKATAAAAAQPAVDKKEDTVEDDDEDSSVLDVPREELHVDTLEGRDFYEQMRYNGQWYTVGQYVCLRPAVDGQQPPVYRLDRMWRDQRIGGDAYFSGPQFARPIDIVHEPSRMFLRRELFGVEAPDAVVPMTRLLRKCAVLLLKDYAQLRPTEIAEQDVYVLQYKVPGRKEEGSSGLNCTLTEPQAAARAKDTADGDSMDTTSCQDVPLSPQPAAGSTPMHEASQRRMRSLKMYKLGDQVVEDELYFFNKPYAPSKEPSPLLAAADTTVDESICTSLMMEGTMDNASDMDLSVDFSALHKQNSSMMSPACASTPTAKNNASRSRSGYILFSAEVRRRVMADNPDVGFGDISRMVGQEWKTLPDERKKVYEERAAQIAREREKTDKTGPPPSRGQAGQILVYSCRWQACDWMFESGDMLFDHMTSVHTSQIVEGGENQFVCLWTSCTKYRKDGRPFPSIPRLHRHIKEKHIATGYKFIYPNQRSRNYVCSLTTQQQQSNSSHSLHSTATASVPHTSAGVGQPPMMHYANQPGAAAHVGHSIAYSQHQQQQAPPTFVSQPQVSYHQQQQHAAAAHQMANGAVVSSHQLPPPPHSSAALAAQQQAAAAANKPIGVQPAPMTATGPVDPSQIVVQATAQVQPVFVAPPDSQRVTRVLHSEAYLRYIENMYKQPDQQSVTKWDAALGASRHANAQPPPSGDKLKQASGWLAPGVQEDEVVQSLWNLRDHMLRDSLQIARVLDVSEW